MNLASLSHGGDDNQDRQEVPEYPDGDNCDMEEDEESPSGANKEKEEEEEVVPVMLGRCVPATESLPSIIKEMEKIFLDLGFNQVVAQKLVDDQEIDSSKTLTSLSDEDITAICDVIRRPGGLVGNKTPDRGNKISVLATNNLKLAGYIFKMMAHCSRTYNIRLFGSTTALKYQQQRELKQKKPDNIKEPK